jgi:DNA-binding ferritin-like protein (Dps family)
MATPEEIKKQVIETSQIVENTLKSVASQIGDIFQDALSEADGITKIFGKDVQKQLNSLARSTDKMIENQLKINAGQSASKDISKQLLDYQTKREVLEKRINNLMGEQPVLAAQLASQLRDVDAANADYVEGLKEQEEQLKKIEKRMGVMGKLVKGLNKIPIIGNLINADEVETQMKKAAANGKSPLIAGFKEVGKSIKDGMLDPLTLVVFFTNQALKANKQTVELGKALGKESSVYRENLANVSRTSNNINVTTENLVGAFNELAKESGYVYEYSVDQLETQVKLTKQVGLQAEEAAQIQRFGVLNNKTSEETYNTFVKGLTAARNQYKVGIDFKATLAEAAKVSGQLAANLGFNPERISKAVVAAKAFGMTLEQTAKSGEALLNFEDSIGNQLKAELLTGKQLNLERARAAALQGDQATLAEELSKNIGTAAEFTKMNVLQQKSLAESVNMTADELSNTLRRREEAIASGKSLAQITEEEAKQALERQNVQDKFNNAMLKLQDIVGNLVAGPFGQLLDIVSSIANVILKIIQPFASVASAILSPILGGINSVLGGIGSADDMVGYGARTLITPTGAVALNNNDTVIAGTNLFKGDDVASFPKGALKLGGSNNGKLEELMSTLIDVTKSTKIGVNLDGRAVGTGIVRATYQSA